MVPQLAQAGGATAGSAMLRRERVPSRPTSGDHSVIPPALNYEYTSNRNLQPQNEVKQGFALHSRHSGALESVGLVPIGGAGLLRRPVHSSITVLCSLQVCAGFEVASSAACLSSADQPPLLARGT